MNDTEKFMTYYKDTKEKLNEKIKEYNENLEKDKGPILKPNFSYFTNLNSDGKLVRGTLVDLGYYLLKEDKDYALDLALAYEVFQTGILVHDDIIDEDEKRRGKDTIHYANYEKYKQYGEEEARHLGDSLAICMGTYGMYDAARLISTKYHDTKNLGAILTNFINTVLTTIRGELIDVILPFQGKAGILEEEKLEDNVMDIYRLKTAHYTIIGPLSVGILLADGTEDQLKDIAKFGEKAGIAFQIQDDILGIYSDEMGKIKGSDIKEFKQTILYSYILKTKWKKEFLKYYGKKELTEEEIEKVQDLLKESGAYEKAVEKMNTFYDESLQILEKISWIKEEKKSLLRGFVEYLRNRKK